MAHVAVGNNVNIFISNEGLVRVTTEKNAEPHDNEIKLKGIHSVGILINPDTIVKAALELFCSGDMILDQAEPIFRVRHPVDGIEQEVELIKFADGTEWRKRTTLNPEPNRLKKGNDNGGKNDGHRSKANN
jgi:peroxiredoxin family protein